MSKPYTKREDELLTLHRPTLTITQLVTILEEHHFTRSSDSIRHRCNALGLTGPSTKIQPIGEEKDKMEVAIDKVFDTKTRPAKAPAILKGNRKILSLSDWHIPFHRAELIEEAIHEHKDADVVVVNGDFLDMYAASTFTKHKHIPLIKEYNIGLKYIQKLSNSFPEVHLVSGNHEDRLTKMFSKLISMDVSSLVCTDILSRLQNGEMYDTDGTVKELLPFDNVFYDQKNRFYTRIGQTLFVHPSKYKSGPGGTVQAVASYFFGRFPFDSVVVGHTHQAGTYHYKGHLLIEQGCLAKALEYQISPELSYGQQNNGYAVIYQDKDGNTDKRNSRHIWCDSLPHPIE